MPNGSFYHLKAKVQLEGDYWWVRESDKLVAGQSGADITVGHLLAFQGFAIHSMVEG